MLEVMNLVGTLLVAFFSLVMLALFIFSERGVSYTPEIARRSEQLDRFELFDQRNQQIVILLRLKRRLDRARRVTPPVGWDSVDAGLTSPAPIGWDSVEA